MTYFHAVLLIDHHEARLLQFDAEHVQASRVKEHRHLSHRHRSGVRTMHEFFGEVCDALEGITEVLVTGSHTAIADFERYAHKHRPAIAGHLVGHEMVDQPTEPQLVALARRWFLRHDRMTGVPTPT
jgi:stalled ribosome rescue protein Dom34